MIVYRVTNRLNGDAYIGVTGRSAKRRWWEHRRNARRGEPGRLCDSIRKWGEDAFTMEVVARFSSNVEAWAAEVRLIADEEPVLNMARGGHGNARPASPKTKAKLAEAARGKAFNGYAHLGPIATAKAVRCVDDGIVYPSAAAAARAYGARANCVSMVCAKVKYRHSAAGRRFEYVEA